MSDWTHPVCDDCWDFLHPAHPSPRKGEGEVASCCRCGELTESGIYIRADPDTLPRHSPHGD